jgi:hypothetical protein
MENGAHTFSHLHGREILSAGERRLWRCPTCTWWRDWTDLQCCGCGSARDAVSGDHRQMHVGSERRPRSGVVRLLNVAHLTRPSLLDT